MSPDTTAGSTLAAPPGGKSSTGYAENHFSPTWRFGGSERMNTGCVPVTLTLFCSTLIIQVRSEGVVLGRGGGLASRAFVGLRAAASETFVPPCSCLIHRGFHSNNQIILQLFPVFLQPSGEKKPLRENDNAILWVTFQLPS